MLIQRMGSFFLSLSLFLSRFLYPDLSIGVSFLSEHEALTNPSSIFPGTCQDIEGVSYQDHSTLRNLLSEVAPHGGSWSLHVKGAPYARSFHSEVARHQRARIEATLLSRSLRVVSLRVSLPKLIMG